MKHLLAAFLLGLLILLGLQTAQADKAVSRDAVRKAIELFQQDPSSVGGLSAASSIMAFAKSSDAVHISISKAVAPWLKSQDAPDADTRSILLAAYVAGNVRSQLDSGKAQDDVYAGWQQVIATYDQLRQINPTVKMPEIDDLKAKEKAGTLRAYAAARTGK